MAKKGKAAKKAAKKENKSKAKKVAKSTKKVVAKGKKIAKAKPVAKKANLKKAKPVKKVAVKKASKALPKKAVAKKVVAKKKVEIKAKKPLKKAVASKPESKKKVVAKKAPVIVQKKKEVKKEKAPKAKMAETKLLKKATDEPAKAKKKSEPSTPKFVRPDYKEGKIDINTVVKHSINNSKTPVLPKPNTDSRTRYSDSELVEFKEIIVKKLAEARKDYEILKDTLSHKDDQGTDDTSPSFKLLEDGSEVLSKEETSQLASRQQKFIEGLENALVRIENKTYGICRATGRLISKERLRVVPHATLSIEAKREQV